MFYPYKIVPLFCTPGLLCSLFSVFRALDVHFCMTDTHTGTRHTTLSIYLYIPISPSPLSISISFYLPHLFSPSINFSLAHPLFPSLSLTISPSLPPFRSLSRFMSISPYLPHSLSLYISLFLTHAVFAEIRADRKGKSSSGWHVTTLKQHVRSCGNSFPTLTSRIRKDT